MEKTKIGGAGGQGGHGGYGMRKVVCVCVIEWVWIRMGVRACVFRGKWIWFGFVFFVRLFFVNVLVS